MPELTQQQQRAAAARGNVLVMAGAGTGKTRTLVERCLRLVLDPHDPASLDEVLLVTFTEAAAAEMRQRIRQRLTEELAAAPDSARLQEQLALVDTARISTLHGFCLQLIREHFHELDLDPQLAVLGEAQAQILAARTLEDVLERSVAARNAEAVENLLLAYGDGRPEQVQDLVRRLHEYSQTLPDAADWLARQEAFYGEDQPAAWTAWLVEAFADWRREWLEALASLAPGNAKARACADALRAAPEDPERDEVAAALEALLALDADWPSRQKTALRQPIAALFDDAATLVQWARLDGDRDPLAQDWDWVRPHLLVLLGLTREFANRYSQAKRDQAAVDFHDLEQFALRLLWDSQAGAPTPLAAHWRERLRYVFVDEYQDINAAQDAILRALSREGEAANRFLVGDVKQSIYRFRLANPHIFQRYAEDWRARGTVVALNENFRSPAALLDFANALFAPLMRRALGGVAYDEDARLRSGHAPRDSASGAAVELALRLTGGQAEAGEEDGEAGSDTEEEAALVAERMRAWKEDPAGIWDEASQSRRPARWQDMVVLHRAPGSTAETFARVFQSAGVPLVVRRSGLYDALEVRDLLSLLQLLDNPLQDIPTLAVLRSPLVGLGVDELAAIRLARRDERFWTALAHFHRTLHPHAASALDEAPPELAAARASAWPKVDLFLRRHARWRELARQGSITQCLEAVLDDTGYEAWLATQPRASQRQANLERLLALAGEFDRFQRQGLFRFLDLIESQREVEYEPEPAQLDDADAVRLMSIHQSKGLEFPRVVVAGLGRRFNLRDLSAAVMLDDELGLAPRVKPPRARGSYPSLPHWLAARRGRREALGEELRLLYVAVTRARERLLLVGTARRRTAEEKWDLEAAGLTSVDLARATNALDWIGPLMPTLTGDANWLTQQTGRGALLNWSVATGTRLQPPPVAAAQPAVIAAPAVETPPAEALWSYAHRAATLEPAKASVTSLRRRALAADDEEAVPIFRPAPPSRVAASAGKAPGLSAAERGVAHHRFLQFVALPALGDPAALEAEAARLRVESRLGEAEAAALDFPALAEFGESEVGRRVRAEAAWVRRELEFTTRLSPADFAELGLPGESGLAPDEFVVVQGVVDLAVIAPASVWLLDFKTDAVTPDTLAAKAAAYTPQLRLYARALGRIYARPVTGAWLHFLALNRSVPVALG